MRDAYCVLRILILTQHSALSTQHFVLFTVHCSLFTGKPMQALICRPEGQVALVEDAAPPALPPGWARVRVRRAGICHTDLELARGYKDFSGILGHEFVGLVESCPSHPSWEGVRVVGEINTACGNCAA